MVTIKRCPKCNLEKEAGEFQKNKSRYDGLSAHCKTCCNNYVENWRKENPVQNFIRHLKNKFGMLLETYDRLVSDQSGCCAICQTVMVPPHIDHCHKTKIIRGLLCQFCNMGLGHFKDAPERLHAAARYLEATRESYGLLQ